ncbi:MAG: hypothetical protein HOY71_25905 [Nonomuraea sp.]|nr:hypothetical protein [Nonomuraea sp.]
MGKFDGMDPKLVRELLAEVKRAAGELRSVEGRVTQVMGAAGLATRTTHRPAQVADAADTMIHDVNGRLALLEKKPDPTPVVKGDEHKPTTATPTPTEHKPTTDATPTPTEHKPTTDATPTPTEHKPTTDTDDHKPSEQTVTGHATADDTRKLDPHKPHVVVVDGVKVLQVPIDPPTATELNDLIKNIDKIQPHAVPSVTDTSGGDVVSIDTKPISPEALKNLIEHIREIPPVDMPGVEVPKGEWGHGDWVPKDIHPDGPPGTVDPGAPTHHTTPPGSPTSDTTTPTSGATTPTSGSAVPYGDAGAGVATHGGESAGAAPTQADGTQVTAAHPGTGTDAYSKDGDVVSAEAKPLDLDGLRTLHDHVREVQPLDMPGVEVPKGEWGHGEWTPKDIEPDGPPGTVEPGGPERSA